MLVRLLTRHANRRCMLHKKERVNHHHAGNSVQKKKRRLLCECPALERARSKTFSRAQLEPDQIKEVRLSSIVNRAKGWGC